MSPAPTRRGFLLGMWQPTPAQPVASARAAPARLVAKIQPFDCLAQRGQVCTVCAERCPVPGAVVVEAARVRVVEEVCTGCGVCQAVCPAPQSAILLWPGLPTR